MSNTQFAKTAAPTESTPAPAELNDRDLDQVNGGLLPAVAPAKGKCPTAVE